MGQTVSTEFDGVPEIARLNKRIEHVRKQLEITKARGVEKQTARSTEMNQVWVQLKQKQVELWSTARKANNFIGIWGYMNIIKQPKLIDNASYKTSRQQLRPSIALGSIATSKRDKHRKKKSSTDNDDDKSVISTKSTKSTKSSKSFLKRTTRNKI